MSDSLSSRRWSFRIAAKEFSSTGTAPQVLWFFNYSSRRFLSINDHWINAPIHLLNCTCCEHTFGNRGWVPKGGVNPLTRQEGQIEGTVEFLGTIRKSETRETFTPKNPEASNKWPVRWVRGDNYGMGHFMQIPFQRRLRTREKTRHRSHFCGCKRGILGQGRPNRRPDKSEAEKWSFILHDYMVHSQCGNAPRLVKDVQIYLTADLYWYAFCTRCSTR